MGAPGPPILGTWEAVTANQPPRALSLPAMTHGLIRYQQSGDFHFLTFSCYQRLPNLRSATARELFESALERVRLRFHIAVAGYVVMPEHVHLLVSEPREGDLSSAVRSLKLSVSLRNTEKPFWQARYYDFNVRTENKFTEKLRYIHRNPVARGLVSKPEEWPWSSYRHYATGSRGNVEIESFWTAARRGYVLPEGFEINKSPS